MEDHQAIRHVHETSFPTRGEADLVDRLRQSGRLAVSLVAEIEGRLVGHLALSPVTSPGGHGLGLAPVAVLPEFRRQGVARRLIERGLEAEADYIVVLGDPAYYERFGFRPASLYGYSDTFGGGDAFQILELRPGGLPSQPGLVRYAPEFDELE